MKIFSWKENKICGRNGNKKLNPTSHNYQLQKESHREEEFSDWPQGLLAIGTFGNRDLKEDPPGRIHLFDPLTEETRELEHDQDGTTRDNPELDNPSTTVVVCEEKGLGVDKNLVNKKSFSILLKNMLVCGGKFSPTPNACLRDPVSDSRMEKVLRAMLHKKIYPQNSKPTMSMKRCLENGEKFSRSISDHKSDDEYDEGCKWIKTDSEYIVLEIQNFLCCESGTDTGS